jgi:O-antigen ligase
MNRLLNRLFLIWQKAEPFLAVLLLLYFTGVDLNYFLENLLNKYSYPLILLLLIGIRNWRRIAYLATREVSILLLLSLGIASFLWSASPDYSLDEIKAVVRAYAFGLYLVARYPLKELFRLFGITAAIAVTLSFLLPLAIPSYGRGIAATSGGGYVEAWEGIYSHKQNFGIMMVFSAITFQAIALKEKRWRGLALCGIGLATLLIILAKSKTSLVSLIFVLAIFPLYIFARRSHKKRVILFSLTLVVVGVLATLVFSNLEFIIVDLLGKDMNLNGRIEIWQLAIQKGMERPLLGYGHAGFWTSPDQFRFISYLTWAGGINDGRAHAHGGYVDLFLQYGLIGLCLVLFTMIASLVRVFRLLITQPYAENIWMLQCVCYFLFVQIVEFPMVMSPGTYWTLYVVIALTSILQRERLIRGIGRGIENANTQIMPRSSPAILSESFSAFK